MEKNLKNNIHMYKHIWIYELLCFIPEALYIICVCVCVCAHARARMRTCLLYNVWLSATPWTVACWALQSVEFFRQGYWNGLPFPTIKDLPSPETEPVFFCSTCIGQGCSLPLAPPRKPHKDCDIDYEIDWEVHWRSKEKPLSHRSKMSLSRKEIAKNTVW